MELIILSLFISLVCATIISIVGLKEGYYVIVSFFALFLIFANIMAAKLVVIGPFTVSASLLIYSMTFLLTDTLNEFWGKKKAEKAVKLGFLAILVFVGFIQLSLALTPSEFWPNQEIYETVFGTSLRIAIASITAYIFAQFHDVVSFHFFKRFFNSRYLWLRNTVSTIGSQTIDTVLFYSIAFYGIFPLMDIIVVTLLAKVLIAIIDTPFMYFIRFVQKKFNLNSYLS